MDIYRLYTDIYMLYTCVYTGYIRVYIQAIRRDGLHNTEEGACVGGEGHSLL